MSLQQTLPNWITYELARKIHKRNYMKKIATQENSASAWDRYKQARNEVNNAIQSAKKQYFTHNLGIKWILEKHGSWLTTYVHANMAEFEIFNSEIKVNNEPISSAAEMAELLDQIWQVKYSRQRLSQNSICNPRTQCFLLSHLALALYTGFWTS